MGQKISVSWDIASADTETEKGTGGRGQREEKGCFSVSPIRWRCRASVKESVFVFSQIRSHHHHHGPAWCQDATWGPNMPFFLQTDGSALSLTKDGRLFSVFTSVIVDSEDEEGQLLVGVQHDKTLWHPLLKQSINTDFLQGFLSKQTKRLVCCGKNNGQVVF